MYNLIKFKFINHLQVHDETTSETDSFQSFYSNRETTGSNSDQEGIEVFGSDLPPSHTDIVKSKSDNEEKLSCEADLPSSIGKDFKKRPSNFFAVTRSMMYKYNDTILLHRRNSRNAGRQCFTL